MFRKAVLFGGALHSVCFTGACWTVDEGRYILALQKRPAELVSLALLEHFSLRTISVKNLVETVLLFMPERAGFLANYVLVRLYSECSRLIKLC